MIKIFSPLIKEYRLRKEENRQLHILIESEKEKIRKQRAEKDSTGIFKIKLMKKLRDKYDDRYYENLIAGIREKQLQELSILRRGRRNKYYGSLFALIGILCLVVSLGVNLGTVYENHKLHEADFAVISTEKNAVVQNSAKPSLTPSPTAKAEKDSSETPLPTEIPSTEETAKKTAGTFIENAQAMDNDASDNENSVTNISARAENSKEQSNTGIEETKPVENSDTVSVSSAVQSMPTPAVSTPESQTDTSTTSSGSPASESGKVWISTKGGKKYHLSSDCSKMNSPEEVSVSTAEAKGFTPCKKCFG